MNDVYWLWDGEIAIKGDLVYRVYTEKKHSDPFYSRKEPGWMYKLSELPSGALVSEALKFLNLPEEEWLKNGR